MTAKPRPSEFEIIARYFAPLAAGVPGAASLGDDVALIAVGSGEELVLKTDAIVAGVHFIGDEPAQLIARKLLRVNLSDLAAKGARPLGYLLAAVFPRDIEESWIADFAAGLAEDQSQYGLALLGGDTTATPGPLTLSLTALGTAARGRTPRQVALNFLTRRASLFTIPKASQPEHVRENAGALDFTLSPEELQAIDRTF